MRIAIICLCLVVLCEGYAPRDVTNTQLSKLIDLLQRSYGQKETEARSRVPIITPSKFVANKLGASKIFKRKPVYIADKEEPWSYDLDRLYTFPGADFLVDMIAKNFSSPGPFNPRMMEDFPAEGPRYMYWFLRSLESQWFGSMTMFYNDWVGLPELFTMKITKMVATARMACPSTFFDRFFARWSMGQLLDMFAENDDSMANVLQDNFMTLFPEMPEADKIEMTKMAVYGIHGWIVEDLMQHIYGSGFRDVAVFSHRLYYKIWKYVNYNMTAPSPWNPKMPALSDLMRPVWYKSGVACETGEAVLKRHLGAIALYKECYEQITEGVIRGNIESFVMERAAAYNIVEFPTETFKEVMEDLTERIEDYIEELVDFLETQETAMANMDYVALLQFFEGLEMKGEEGFAKMMFSRLGLIPGTPAMRR